MIRLRPMTTGRDRLFPVCWLFIRAAGRRLEGFRLGGGSAWRGRPLDPTPSTVAFLDCSSPTYHRRAPARIAPQATTYVPPGAATIYVYPVTTMPPTQNSTPQTVSFSPDRPRAMARSETTAAAMPDRSLSLRGPLRSDHAIPRAPIAPQPSQTLLESEFPRPRITFDRVCRRGGPEGRL